MSSVLIYSVENNKYKYRIKKNIVFWWEGVSKLVTGTV